MRTFSAEMSPYWGEIFGISLGRDRFKVGRARQPIVLSSYALDKSPRNKPPHRDCKMSLPSRKVLLEAFAAGVFIEEQPL